MANLALTKVNQMDTKLALHIQVELTRYERQLEFMTSIENVLCSG